MVLNPHDDVENYDDEADLFGNPEENGWSILGYTDEGDEVWTR